MRLTSIIALAFLALTGCAATDPPKPEILIQYRNVPVLPPDDFLKDCDLTAPPDIEAYLNADWSKKEELLMQSYQKSTSQIILCNVERKNLRAWKKEQVRLFNDSQGNPPSK